MLLLVSETIYRVSSLSTIPNQLAGSDSKTFGGTVALQRRLRNGTRTRNLLHVLAGGLAFELVGRRSWRGYVGLGTRGDVWEGGWALMVMC